MSYPVHLEMTHNMAEWLASLLREPDGYDVDECEDLADAILLVSDGRYDTAGIHPDHFVVTIL